jgi:hypothetical protein
MYEIFESVFESLFPGESLNEIFVDWDFIGEASIVLFFLLPWISLVAIRVAEEKGKAIREWFRVRREVREFKRVVGGPVDPRAFKEGHRDFGITYYVGSGSVFFFREDGLYLGDVEVPDSRGIPLESTIAATVGDLKDYEVVRLAVLDELKEKGLVPETLVFGPAPLRKI